MLDKYILKKGERLPSFKSKVHLHSDIKYDWWALFNNENKIFAHYGKPCTRGESRVIIYIGG